MQYNIKIIHTLPKNAEHSIYRLGILYNAYFSYIVGSIYMKCVRVLFVIIYLESIVRKRSCSVSECKWFFKNTFKINF